MRFMVIAITAIFLAPVAAVCAVHEGSVTLLETESWDFSQFASGPYTYGSTFAGDFAYGKYYAGGETVFRLVALDRARIAGGRGFNYDSLTMAPALGDPAYGFYVDTVVGGTFVIFTRDFRYAKIRTTQLYPQLAFEYTYQDDGTRGFDGSTPVGENSWGAIKALYRADH